MTKTIGTIVNKVRIKIMVNLIIGEIRDIRSIPSDNYVLEQYLKVLDERLEIIQLFRVDNVETRTLCKQALAKLRQLHMDVFRDNVRANSIDEIMQLLCKIPVA